MALVIEQISPTKIWIHDGPTSIMEIDTTDGVRINSTFKMGTDLISPSASELAAIDGLTASAAELNIMDGVTKTAALINRLVVGVAGSYNIARSAAPVALDGSNPTSVAHGLTTCVAAFAQLVGSDAPGDSTMLLTAVINGANIDVYAWKHTDGTDPTLVASTGTETFSWFAIGT
jgi:hypothetical protein